MSKYEIKVERVPEFEEAFRTGTKIGWWGSDCAFSTLLGTNQNLWLFGDTFIKADQAANDRINSKLISNTIAIQQNFLIHKEKPLTFYWTRTKDQPKPFFYNDQLDGNYWPFSAALVHGKLYVFGVRIVQVDIQDAFGFRIVGHEIYKVDNPEDDPTNWYKTNYYFPRKDIVQCFGSYVLRAKDNLYIYGFQKETDSFEEDIKLIIAKVDLNEEREIADKSNWEFFDGVAKTWVKDQKKIRPAMDNSKSELSITFLESINKYVLVSVLGKRGKWITVRTADTPVGPFSEPQNVYKIPENDWSPRYFSYAGKAHPELAEADNELIVTYMTNSKSLEECISDTRIYFPKFIRITFL